METIQTETIYFKHEIINMMKENHLPENLIENTLIKGRGTNYLPYCKFFVSLELYNFIPFFTFLHKIVLHK